ncbi:MAG: hypothetical protein U0L12_09895 [Ruminococcus sp.]|nr:hypothetical protein [Ruminococcus sp.]
MIGESFAPISIPKIEKAPKSVVKASKKEIPVAAEPVKKEPKVETKPEKVTVDWNNPMKICQSRNFRKQVSKK